MSGSFEFEDYRYHHKSYLIERVLNGGHREVITDLGIESQELVTGKHEGRILVGSGGLEVKIVHVLAFHL